MDRRKFIKLTGVGMGGLMLPIPGAFISAAELTANPMDVAFKKRMSDIALNAAKAKGATYADARIGRYLNQFITAEEKRVSNIVNTESVGIGIRVIANGTWGFAATSDISPDSIAKTAEQAVAVAKANSKFQTDPVILAPVTGVGEVSWQTPIVKNAFEIPIKEKVDLLMEVNNAALDNGANYITSILFLVNEQKYFASTDGSYIDQDVHRLWAPFFATGIGPTGFKQRSDLGNPVGMGFEYLDGDPAAQVEVDGANVGYGWSYDMVKDARDAGKQLQAKLKARSVEPGKYDLAAPPDVDHPRVSWSSVGA